MARSLGVILAVVSAVLNIGFLAAYPIWSTIMIAVDILVIWALTVHGGEMRDADERRDPALAPSPRGGPDPRRAVQRGKAARAAAGSSHADWKPDGDRDPVEVLMGEAGTRVPELVPVRNGRMLASPFTFYRGAPR